MTMWTERSIARAISLQTLARKCIVLVDNCNWTGHECDVLAVTCDLRIIDIEVKISRADLKADAAKDKWWIRHGWRREQPQQEKTARQHPPKVWKHYYAMPREIWSPELVANLHSPASGILLLDHDGYPRGSDQVMRVKCERRATPAKDAYRLKPEQVIDIARLANLRMWAAYAAVERAKSGGQS